MESVYSEWRNYDRAYQAGGPVAAPMLSELAKSTCSCGCEYLVMAVEFIPNDGMETCRKLWQFSFHAVLTLHQKAGRLQCDLKPGNMRWNNGVVRLIDFEHALDIAANAKWARGTEGYQAPEILEGSTKTDAYSVGATIANIMEAFWRDQQDDDESNQILDMLQEISRNLTDSDPQRRWSLERALQELQETPSS